MADYSTEIAQLEAILNAGVKSVTVDGQTVTHDFDEIRRRLTELRASDDAATVPTTRPRAMRVNLSNFS